METPYLTCNLKTLRKRIPRVSLVTDTDGNVVPHSAVGIDTAQSRAWVLAFSVNAGLVGGTVRVYDTLWSTVGGRADHFRETRTLAPVTDISWRIAVRTAGVRLAGVKHVRFGSCSKQTVRQQKVSFLQISLNLRGGGGRRQAENGSPM